MLAHFGVLGKVNQDRQSENQRPGRNDVFPKNRNASWWAALCRWNSGWAKQQLDRTWSAIITNYRHQQSFISSYLRMFKSLLDLSFSIGPQKNRVVGAATDELDQTSNEVTSILELDQSHATVHSLLLKQGLPP